VYTEDELQLAETTNVIALFTSDKVVGSSKEYLSSQNGEEA
jgi:hypothetical protein